MKPLALFVDPAWRVPAQRHIPLLYPFWGAQLSDRMPYQKQLFEKYGFDTALYRLAPRLEDADMLLLPYLHNVALAHAPSLIQEVAKVGSATGKPILVDGTGDIEHVVAMPRAVVLRYAGYRFLRKQNEVHIPVYADDLLESMCDGSLNVRALSTVPSVGFSGWAHLTPLTRAKSVIKDLPISMRGLFDSRYRACHKGVLFREEAVASLQHSQRVHSRIHVRPSYSAHVHTASKDTKELRREFVDTLLSSDYGLDVRGDANASMRFFEILSLGRIPLVVDTERNFPFDDEIDYGAFSLKVDFRDIKRLPDILADFHARLSAEKFEEMQRAARGAYASSFRIDAMTRHMIARIRARIRTPVSG